MEEAPRDRAAKIIRELQKCYGFLLSGGDRRDCEDYLADQIRDAEIHPSK